MSAPSQEDLTHFTMLALWCSCPTCDRRFIITVEDAAMLTACPFCRGTITYTPGATERIQ